MKPTQPSAQVNPQYLNVEGKFPVMFLFLF